MATSNSLNLIRPKKVWLFLQAIIVAGLLFVVLGSVYSSSVIYKKYLNTQLDLSLKNYINEIEKENYRGITDSFVYASNTGSFTVKRSSHGIVNIGSSLFFDICSERTLSIKGEATIFKLCMPNSYPIFPVISVAIFYLLFAYLSFKIISKLEERAINSFLKFYSNLGLTLSSSSGLLELYARIETYQNELELLRKQNIENSVNASIGKAASVLVHDIRSPIAVIDFLLKSPNLEIQKRDLLEGVLVRLKELTQNLLQYRKQLMGASSKELVDISKFINSCVREAQIISELSGSKIQFEVFSCDVMIDIAKLPFQRSLMNLLMNSIDSMDKAIGKISVTTSVRDDKLIVEVRDNGKGIPVDILPKLGKEGATFGKKDGNGLGIYSVKSFVEEYNGNYIIQSKQYEGTSIILELPIKSPSTPDLALGNHPKNVGR